MLDALLTQIRCLPPPLAVLAVAMLPVLELRGAIPLGAALGMTPWQAFFPAIAGNLAPAPVLLFAFAPISRWVRARSGFHRTLDWLDRRSYARGDKIRRYGWFGLVLLVAVPLPTTGVWTASLAASLLGVPIRAAFSAIVAGTVLAGLLVTILTVVGMNALLPA